MEIRAENLTEQDLREFDFIEAFDEDARIRVWDSKRLPRFVAPDHPVKETKTLYVRLASLEEADLQPLMTKIAALRRARAAH